MMRLCLIDEGEAGASERFTLALYDGEGEVGTFVPSLPTRESALKLGEDWRVFPLVLSLTRTEADEIAHMRSDTTIHTPNHMEVASEAPVSPADAALSRR